MFAKAASKGTAILMSTIIAFTNNSSGQDLGEAINDYQQSLIEQEITGSNVVMVFKEGKKIYHQAVQSGLTGDQAIEEETIFPIWSMSKPITTVAMMMLHEEGKLNWDDEVSKFLPCFQSLTWRDGETIRPCTQPLKIIHLMTHRSGWT